MMTFSKGNPVQGLSYHSKDSYFLAEEIGGVWWGKGANQLHLKNEINARDFQNTLNGYNSRGEGLLRNSGAENRNSYTDCTFSTPKSVSLMAELDPQIHKAHETALLCVLKEMEQRYSITRKGAGGKLKEVTENLTVARFNHFENRNMEPHLHTHCLIMNMTQGKDGIWRTIDNREMLKSQRFLRALYDNELRCELHKLGYKTRQSLRTGGRGNQITDTFELEGISNAIIDKYSSRTSEINEGIQERIDSGVKVDSITLYEEQKLKTRKSKKREGAKELCKEIKDRVKQEPDLLELQKSRDLQPEQSPKSIIERALEDISETKAAFTENEVLQHAMLLSMNESVPFDQLRNTFRKRAIQLTKELYTIEEIQKATHHTVALAKQGILSSDLTIPNHDVEHYLQEVEKQGILFKQGQRDAIASMTSSRDSVNVIQGDAGTGKTFAVEHLQTLFKQNSINMRGFAPTGKAATELESVGLPSSTLDSFFMSVKHKPDCVKSNEVWVLDESSMVGSIKMAKFLQKAREYNAKVLLLGDVKQLQSVEAGRVFDDIQKHTGVTQAYMGERIRQKSDHLRKIVSYANDGDSLGAVRSLVDSNSVFEVKEPVQRIKQVAQEIVQDRVDRKSSFILAQTNRERSEINNQVRANLQSKALLSEGVEQEVFSSAGMTKQRRRSSMNYEAGQVLFTSGRAGSLPPGSRAYIESVNHEENTLSVKYWDKREKCYANTDLKLSHCGNQLNVFNVEKKEFSIDDEIIFLKNDKKLKITNGTLGKVVAISPNGDIEISVAGRKDPVSFNIRSEYNYLDHGYALTTYKSQGATVDKVICTTDTKSFKTNSNEFYVAVTRAKHEISFYTDSLQGLIEQAGIKQEKASIFDYQQKEHRKKEISKNRLEKSIEGKENTKKENTISMSI